MFRCVYTVDNGGSPVYLQIGHDAIFGNIRNLATPNPLNE